MYIWRFCKKAQKNLEIRTSNLETSKICVKNMQSPGGGEDRGCTKTATAFWSTVRLRGKALFDIPNRESHGQTVRVGRSASSLQFPNGFSGNLTVPSDFYPKFPDIFAQWWYVRDRNVNTTPVLTFVICSWAEASVFTTRTEVDGQNLARTRAND